MSDNPKHTDEPPLIYQVRIRGHLANDWADWFGGAVVGREEDGNTLLICQVIDQAALHGLLRQIRDLGLPLISINPIRPSITTSSRATTGAKTNTVTKTNKERHNDS